VTRKGAHTPVTDEDIEEIIGRFVTSVEEVETAYDPAEWADFIRGKLWYDPSEAQLRVFEQARVRALERWEAVPERPIWLELMERLILRPIAWLRRLLGR